MKEIHEFHKRRGSKVLCESTTAEPELAVEKHQSSRIDVVSHEDPVLINVS